MQASLRIPEARDDWAMFLDIDGTLVDIAPTPDGVQLDPGLLPVLRRLRERLGGALALVSGRSLAALDAMFRPERFAAAGIHGIERRDAEGQVRFAGMEPEALEPARRVIGPFLAAHPRLRMEDKGRSIALHYRLAPELELPVQRVLEEALTRLPSEAHLQGGSGVLELKSRAATKRSALESFLGEPPFRGRVPVFAGDDLTDRDALAYVRSIGGVAIHVDGDPVPTDAWFRDPAALRAWLAKLAP